MRSELPGVVEETRFDAETVRQAVLLATRLQSEREKTLSAAEVEALGTELGIDPACLRQALAAIERSGPATRPDPARRPWRLVAFSVTGALLSATLLYGMVRTVTPVH